NVNGLSNKKKRTGEDLASPGPVNHHYASPNLRSGRSLPSVRLAWIAEEIAVVDEPEPVGEPERSADRRQERRQHVGADVDRVVRPQVHVRLLAREHLRAVAA